MLKFITIFLFILIYVKYKFIHSKSFNYNKNFLNKKIIKNYLEIAKRHVETPSKYGNTVQKKIKIRTDIFFNTDESKILDKFINCKLPYINKIFNIKINYRENYKLGKYYGKKKGFYNYHTDLLGGYNHRKISMVICLTKKTDYEGGEFQFKDSNKKFKLDYGDALFFKSELSHKVNPVTKGLRQVIISFMWDIKSELERQKRFKDINKNYFFNNN